MNLQIGSIRLFNPVALPSLQSGLDKLWVSECCPARLIR